MRNRMDGDVTTDTAAAAGETPSQALMSEATAPGPQEQGEAGKRGAEQWPPPPGSSAAVGPCGRCPAVPLVAAGSGAAGPGSGPDATPTGGAPAGSLTREEKPEARPAVHTR